MFGNEEFTKAVNSQIQNVITLGNEQGFLPGGINGPYLDIESPLRNTSHWLISFAVQYAITGDTAFRHTCDRLMNFLMHNSAYSMVDIPIHRQKTGKDWCNGVIGQAWIAEGLLVSGSIIGRKDAIEKAEHMLLQLPFNQRYGIWSCMDPRIGDGGFDTTYNHQCWYAAVCAESDNSILKDRAQRFLDVSADGALDIRHTGLIYHNLQHLPDSKIHRLMQNPLHLIGNKLLAVGAKKTHQTDKNERDIGYHLYDLYALARLKLAFPGHGLWSSNKIRKAVDYAASTEFMHSLQDNYYAYPYNAPGFEYPLISLAFSDSHPQLQQCAENAWRVQIEKSWNPDLSLFIDNTYDPVTLAARMYEFALYEFHRSSQKL
ncbi:hypothetical protein Spiaf_0036 [Spirochaeta africana DSM 8902]|uniref:Uncharacterized protein n=1 Tax=Spirochaeta africana (strain ATCC 700263 / DSM 8902 / Z-7692) TaxID=889378 RepID=H9UF52_SPIAZ|nr:hypothetical protein Spiaf_0036 [Spirochaeta africana DSM 8902]